MGSGAGIGKDGATTDVDDDPQFRILEHAVLFLKRFAPGHYFTLGGPAGRFPIDAAGNVHAMPGGSVLTPPTGAAIGFLASVRAFTARTH